MNTRAFVFFLAVLLVATGPVFGALTDGLVLYYSFDTNTGTTVTDKSGNGHTGVVNGPTYTSAGRIGGAYHYDGTNDYILAGNLGYLGKGTISFWMYADALDPACWRNPFSTDYASWDDCLRFEDDAQGNFVVGLGPIVGGAYYTTNLQPRVWTHVVFAWTTNGYWGWLNGKPAFTGAHNNKLYLNFNNVAMGNGYSTDPGRYWKGLVDEVRIYNRVLTGTEVAELAKLSDGLLLYYSFDTNTGSTVYDQSGNGHTGTVYGATYTPGGAIGAAYHFDGIDDRILGGSLGYVPTGAICFWMYADAVENWRNPFSTDYASWDDNIHFTEAADHSFMWGALGLEPGEAVSYTEDGLQTGRWYHVALTWDGLVTRGYLDGTLANSTPYPDTNAPVHPDISGNAGYWRQLSLTFNNIAVGNSYSTSPDRYWKGMVDEVRIYNRALTGAEIVSLAVQTNVPIQRGSVRVDILPADAAVVGGWRLSTEPDAVWHSSGAVLSNIVAGSYPIVFKPAAGWAAPTDVTAGIIGSSMTIVTGIYATIKVSTNDLVLYYSFDTNTGSTVYDQSGNGHTGLIYGPAYTATGRIGGAYQYDGVNDHILAGNLGHLGQGTISFWMYADAIENWRNPFSTDYASWDDCLRFEESLPGDFVVGLGPILGGAFYTSAMQSRTWYHVAFAWTGTGYWGWLNGQLAFSGSHNNQLYLDFNNVAMGNGYSTSPDRYWKGMVDEVRIYNRVLSDGEVSALAGTGAVATVGWLTVNIEPEGARIAEAQWRLASDAVTNWYDSGFSRCLEADDYTVVFKPLGGWVTPSSANITIVAGSNSCIAGHYEAVTADTVPPVIVSIYPPDGYVCLGNDVPMIVVVTDNVAVASVRFNNSNAVEFEPPNTYLYTRNGVRGSFNAVDIVARDTYDNVATQSINYAQSSRLLLTSMWDGYWRVRNPFTNTIDCTWNVACGTESGLVVAVANRDSFFSTSLGPKTVRLYTNGVLVDTKASSLVPPPQGALSLAEIDSDGDGMNNGEEELAGTDPNSPESLFSLGMDWQSPETVGMMMKTVMPPGSSESEFYSMIFSWPSGTDSSYTLETSTDVWTWKAVTGAINVPGTGGIMSYTNRSDSPQFYLRIRAQKLE